MQAKERAEAIVKELRSLGTESTKRTLMRHGAPDSIFGVKIEELKKIQKRVKKDHELALALFDTGIGDAMYLAGLIADDEKMTKKDLQRWIEAGKLVDGLRVHGAVGRRRKQARSRDRPGVDRVEGGADRGGRLDHTRGPRGDQGRFRT